MQLCIAEIHQTQVAVFRLAVWLETYNAGLMCIIFHHSRWPSQSVNIKTALLLRTASSCFHFTMLPHVLANMYSITMCPGAHDELDRWAFSVEGTAQWYVVGLHALGHEFKSWWDKNNFNLKFRKWWAVMEIVNTYLWSVYPIVKYAFSYGCLHGNAEDYIIYYIFRFLSSMNNIFICPVGSAGATFMCTYRAHS